MEESARPSSFIATPAVKADLAKGAVAQIVEEEIRDGVVGDEDVEIAVAVVIGEGDAHAFSDVPAMPDFAGDIGERAVAVVVIERVRAGRS